MEGIVILILIVLLSSLSPRKKNGKAKAGRHTSQRFSPFENQSRTPTQPMQQSIFPDFPVSAPAEGEGSVQQVWKGSLNAETFEGEDLCDPELGHADERLLDERSVYAGEIKDEPLVDFSAKGIVQGVIMSEILTRPSQRTRR